MICLCQGIWVAFQEGRLEQRKGWRGKNSRRWAGVRLEGAGKVWLRWAVLSRPWGPRAMNSILESDRLARILNLPLPECATCPPSLKTHESFSLTRPDQGWRMDTCICMAEYLRCSPETITTLLIGYTPDTKCFWCLKKKWIKILFSFLKGEMQSCPLGEEIYTCSTSAVTSGEGAPLPPHENARRRDQGMGSPRTHC